MMSFGVSLLLLILFKIKQVANEDIDFTQERIDSGFNSSHALFQSILFCGTDIICNKSLLALFDIPNQLEPATSKCGTCSCSEHCFTSPFRNCCPDIFFRHGLLECRDVHILSKVTNTQEVVASCPKGTRIQPSRKCTKERSKVSTLRHPPVTSSMTNISYINKYCANCNMASELKEWSVTFGCPSPVDFNYFSSYQDIINHANVQLCNVLFNSPISSRYCSMRSSQSVASCNVTGSWINYDKQIEKACHSSYDTPMGIFKNIFCTICNPPEFQDDLMIEECENSTSTFKEACSFLPVQEASFPYKNYFCSACNSNGNRIPYYTDVTLGSVNEFYKKNEDHPFQFTISFTYNAANVNRYIKEVLKKSNVERSDSSPPVGNGNYGKENQVQHPLKVISLPISKDPVSAVQSFSINITNLIRTSFAFSRHGACTPGLLPNYTIPLQKSCSCTVGCRSDCCDDFALRQPWTCIDDRYNRDGESKDYLAIGGCLMNHNMDNVCTGSNISQIYQAFPVTSKNKDKVTYVNIFCYFCNQNVSDGYDVNITENAVEDLDIWPWHVRCSVYVDYRQFGSLLSLMNYISQTSCIGSFVPVSNAAKCIDSFVTEDTIETCNMSTWLPVDEDIRTACEHSEIFRFPQIRMDNNIYKNKFCAICNVMGISVNPFDFPCSSFPDNSSILNACEEFPNINVCRPYKNAVCEMCITNDTESPCYEVLDLKLPCHCASSGGRSGGRPHPTSSPDPPPNIGTFRSTFTLADYDRYSSVAKQDTSLKCLHSQMFDEFKHTCRNVTCFPGKLLRNDACVSLLEETSKLRYTIALKIEFSTYLTTNATVNESIVGIGDYITQKVVNLIKTDVIIEDVISLSPGRCDADFTGLRKVFLYLKIFINGTANRDKVEQDLSDFIEYPIEWHLPNYFERGTNASRIIVSRSQLSLHLPSAIQERDNNSSCIVSKHERQVPVLYRNVLVSPLLTCPQVILKDNEFGVDWKNVEFGDTFLGFSNFSERGMVRVCTKDISLYLRSLHVWQSETRISPLMVLTLVCIITSLICLILTFVTYCIFPNLRTLPGINNMFLVVSLVLSQLLMIVRPLFHASGRPIVSVLLHFSWLSSFVWLQVCSFHAFRVVNANGKSTFAGSQIRKTIYQYIIYAYGSSFITVLSNIVVSLIVTNGTTMEYDKTHTLMTYKTSFIATLIAPLIFICVTNVIFYAFTAYRICSTPKIEKASGNRVHFTVYVQLFCLTGLSWVLQLIDTFWELSVLTYIVAILNGLQGVFMFVSYVCNERVWRMYRNACCSIHSFQRSIATRSEADTAI